MSIGEPQHAPPQFVLDDAAATTSTGSAATRRRPGCRSCAPPCARLAGAPLRLGRGSVDPDTMVLPVNGTREALFAFVQAVVDARQRAARG